jgi:hypothetical protein
MEVNELMHCREVKIDDLVGEYLQKKKKKKKKKKNKLIERGWIKKFDY